MNSSNMKLFIDSPMYESATSMKKTNQGEELCRQLSQIFHRMVIIGFRSMASWWNIFNFKVHNSWVKQKATLHFIGNNVAQYGWHIT